MKPADLRMDSSSSTKWTIRLGVMLILRAGLHQGEMKSSASVRRAVGPDPAAMGFDDRSTERKAKAHAVGLAAHKGFEKLGRDLIGYNWARVRSEEHKSELKTLMHI